MKFRVTVVITVAAVLLTLPFIGCGQATPTTAIEEPSPTPIPPTTTPIPPGGIEIALALLKLPEGNVVARVNGEAVLTDVYRQELTRQLKVATTRYGLDWNDPNNTSVLPLFQQQILDQLINLELIRQLAKSEGLDQVTEADIDAEVEKNKAEIASSATYASWEEFLQLNELTEESFRRYVRDSVVINRMFEAHGGPSEVEQVHALHILVEDEATGKEVLEKLAAGEKFEDLAAQYSIDTGSKDQGGDLGWFPKGLMVSEFEEAAFALEPGETSALVQTQFGYHIIRVVEKGIRELDPDIKVQVQEEAFNQWFDEQKAKATIETLLDLGTSSP
ncbi:MAG: peptidylprolyl isomerase [Chloroflexi bacterium]|nr:peptidylprolyl isomerase [Chloroflexota bacterium]